METTCLAPGCQRETAQTATGKRLKYCSKKCKDVYWSSLKKKPESDKICIICKKPFRTNRKHTKCCSKKCTLIRESDNAKIRQKRAWERAKENKVPVVRKCLWCKEEFIVSSDKRKYCSKECRNKGTQAKIPKRILIEKICPVCGNSFIPVKTNSQKYCSGLCKRIDVDKKRIENLVCVEKQCKNKECSKMFKTTKSKLRKYCSDKCRYVSMRKFQKDNKMIMRARVKKCESREGHKYYKGLYRRLGTLRPDLRSRYWELLGLKNKKELLVYINRIKKPGMNVKNRGSFNSHEVWQLDHKIPFSSINIHDDVEFAKIFHYSNLQCLWGDDHYEKSSYE